MAQEPAAIRFGFSADRWYDALCLFSCTLGLTPPRRRSWRGRRFSHHNLLHGELHEIVTAGFEKLRLSCPDRLAWRIACLSDGFAHFTHLLCLKLAVRAIDSGAAELHADLFSEALSDAIEDSAAFLKTAYEQAVQKYQNKYEPVLWAAADHWELLRSTEHMYDSYQRICIDLRVQPQDRSSFSSILFQLKQEKHGSVLKSDRRSWYQFTQAMMRGYCRIVAHSKNIEVGLDYMKTGQGPA